MDQAPAQGGLVDHQGILSTAVDGDMQKSVRKLDLARVGDQPKIACHALEHAGQVIGKAQRMEGGHRDLLRHRHAQQGIPARERRPWLAHQNATGLAIQLADLIHLLYFKQRPWVQHALLLLGWLSRPSTVNPWIRRQMHFHHHKKAGHPSDFEERAITNGEAWGLKRLFMTLDNMLNFGSTHAIHHFVVGQPFYLRQMIAAKAHEVLRNQGVRFNDLGTFRRANRLHPA